MLVYKFLLPNRVHVVRPAQGNRQGPGGVARGAFDYLSGMPLQLGRGYIVIGHKGTARTLDRPFGMRASVAGLTVDARMSFAQAVEHPFPVACDLFGKPPVGSNNGRSVRIMIAVSLDQANAVLCDYYIGAGGEV